MRLTHASSCASLAFLSRATATPGLSTLSLHDALPIQRPLFYAAGADAATDRPAHIRSASGLAAVRSEEHTSELQSRLHLVCRLLLEKKKNSAIRTHLPAGHAQPRCKSVPTEARRAVER